jgi:ferredoxin-type protein NapG
MKKLQSDSRRKALLSGLKAAGLAVMGSLTWSAFLNDRAKAATSLLLRPPGAKSEEEFLKSCVRCGLCVEACPYHTLKLATVGSNFTLGMPYFVPSETPCYMCPDVPCVPVCPTSALDKELLKSETKLLDINKAKMGIAVVDTLNCVAFSGLRCEVCIQVCPLKNSAIKLELKRNERTGKHAMYIPVVDNEICTGCGLCEKACITAKASIFVLPAHVYGAPQSTYARGWIDADTQRVEGQDAESYKGGVKGAQNYLNNEEF